jgi:hypothetical protein
MVEILDTVLGLFLGVSAFLLVLSVMSYRRSGVRPLLLMSGALAAHIVLTMSILALAYTTEWFDEVDAIIVVVVDAAVLVAAILVGLVGGRRIAGPP